MSKRSVMKTWGTWYTAEGERADAWPAEGRTASGPGTKIRDALVAGSRHGLCGAGPGLSGVVKAGLTGTGALGRLF